MPLFGRRGRSSDAIGIGYFGWRMLATLGAPFSQAPVVTKSGGREHKECCPCAGSPSRSGQRAGPARVHQIRNVSLSLSELSEERVGVMVALL